MACHVPCVRVRWCRVIASRVLLVCFSCAAIHPVPGVCVCRIQQAAHALRAQVVTIDRYSAHTLTHTHNTLDAPSVLDREAQ
jgi:hypothetical protein